MAHSTTPTDAQLAEWERLAGAAIPPPWRVELTLEGVTLRMPEVDSGTCRTWDTIAFIAASREAVPALIAALREAQRERDEARDYAASIAAGVDHYTHRVHTPCVRCERDEARAEAERLRGALRLAEWGCHGDECPHCCERPEDGHWAGSATEPPCKIAAALSGQPPEKKLPREGD